MAELSPQAQAVLDAFRTSHTGQGCLAAAIRAASGRIEANSPWGGHLEHTGVCWAADHLLAIATELEGDPGSSSTH